MDMEHPFESKPKYRFYDKQLSRMTSIEKISKGTTVGFSAFDIKRFSKEDFDKDEIIFHVEKSLSSAKLGFKFYPPMGFRAAENPESKFEAIADCFFNYCVEHAIPVFTHCTHYGFQLTKGSGENSDPDFWEAALSKPDHPNRNTLILCFGHAGGGMYEEKGEKGLGWLSGADECIWDHRYNYARKVANLCRKFPNVYCDLAYISPIIDHPEQKEALKARLEIEYARPVTAEFPYKLEDKMLYGSDWHMKSMVNDLDKYFEAIREIYDSPVLACIQSKFFAKNALAYINLAGFIDRAREQLDETCALQLSKVVETSSRLE